MPETVARWHRRGLIARMARDNPGWGAERIRRELIHLNVTASPTAAWIRRQAIAATPWGRTPAYLVRDRDAVYGREFVEQARRLGMATVLTPLRRVTTAGLFAPATDTPRTRAVP